MSLKGLSRLKKAFSPSEIKRGITVEEGAGNTPDRYFNIVFTDFLKQNPNLEADLGIENPKILDILPTRDKKLKARYEAIDKIIFSSSPQFREEGVNEITDLLSMKKPSTNLRGSATVEEEEEKESENPSGSMVEPSGMNTPPNEPEETEDIPVVYPPAGPLNPEPADPFEGLPPMPLPSIARSTSNREEAEARLQATIDSMPTGEAEAVADPNPVATEPAVTPKVTNASAVSTEIKRSVSTVEQPSFGSTKDSIPKKRLISDGKSATQLYNDILYFRKNFPNETRNIEFDSRNRNPEYLLRKHKEYVSKLKPEGEGDKKVGVIITASEYIKDKLKEIILENSINGLTAKDLVIDIEGETDKSEDIQSYEFKTGPNGMPFAKKEPIYKYIPETNQSQTQSTIGRIPNPVTKYRGLEVTAKNLVRQDPFVKPRKTIRLKYSY